MERSAPADAPEPVIPVAGETDATPERFDPAAMRGQLIEAEHVARYQFAAPLVVGKRVLDAGCGWAYGSNLMARAGADEVHGVDISESVIEAASEETEPGVTLSVADVTDLPFEDGEFEVVVCFEVIEHLEQRDKVLAEFARVLANDGLLLISSPNRDVYGERNPFHVHEYLPEEFEHFLSTEFEHVKLFAQQNWITSYISTRENLAAQNVDIDRARIRKVAGRTIGDETYLIAIASSAPLPHPQEVLLMTFETELLEWLERWEAQDEILRGQLEVVERQRWDEFADIQRRFVETRSEIADAERRAIALQRDLDALQGSISWRITRPLRENRILRRLIGRG